MMNQDCIFYDLLQNSDLKNIKTITDELNHGGELCGIRHAIADLIEHYLHHGKDTNNVVALPFFINAIGSLTLNVNSRRRTTQVGLYACLTDLAQAIAALKGKPKPFRQSVESIETITYDFLFEALEAIRGTPAFQNMQ